MMMKTRIKWSLSVLCCLGVLVNCESNSSPSPSTATFSARQAKDYSGGGGIGGGGGGTTGGLYSAAAYGVPSASSGGSSYAGVNNGYAGVSNGYGMGVAGAGSYPPAHYAIAPIVMGSASGMGWYDDNSGGGGGGEDYKELLGLLGLKGIKGVKGLKGLKLLKGLGLLPLLPILAPLLLLAPLLFLLPLLLPLLLLLLLVPIPIITIPPTSGRRRRDINQNGHKTLMQETLDDIAGRIPQSIMNMNPKDVHNCMDKFICDTGVFVSHHAPGFIGPAAWLLSSIWPEELQPKVETFKRVANLPRAKQFNVCNTNYKCRIKKLEHLFHGLVTEYSGKLRKKISNRLQQNREPISPSSVLSALMS